MQGPFRPFLAQLDRKSTRASPRNGIRIYFCQEYGILASYKNDFIPFLFSFFRGDRCIFCGISCVHIIVVHALENTVVEVVDNLVTGHVDR